MTIQVQLDAIALNYFPRIQKIISESEKFEANQIKCKTTQLICDANKSIDSMTCQELQIFENEMIEIFRFKNWINN